MTSFLLAVIAIVAILALLTIDRSLPRSAQQVNDQSQPTQHQTNPKPPPPQQQNNKEPSNRPEVQESENYWERFVRFVEANDKSVSAFSTIVISVFTVILALSTLALWLATKNLVSGADDTAKRQLRAYVGSELQPEWRGINDGAPLAQKFALVNYGQTPARAVVVSGIIEILPYPMPADYPMPNLIRYPQSVIVFPNQLRNVPSGFITANRAFTAEEIASIKNEKIPTRVYLIGSISYRDIFDESRTTTFRSFIDPISVRFDQTARISGFVWGIDQEGNDFH